MPEGRVQSRQWRWARRSARRSRAHPDIDMVSFTGSTRAGISSPRPPPTPSSACTRSSAASRRTSFSPMPISRRRCRAACCAASPIAASRATRRPACWCRASQLRRGASAIAKARPRVQRRRSARSRRPTIGPGGQQGAVRQDPGPDRARHRRGRDARSPAAPAGPPGSTAAITCARPCSPTSRHDMTIAREEIFGPVLSILPYETKTKPSRIANDTIYGLAGYVQSGDLAHARRVARAASAPAASISTARPAIAARRSAATSNPATAASTASSASRSFSR